MERYRKLWKKLNSVYDNIMMAVFAVIFLVVVYFIYDAYYVYSHASDKNILNYKPTSPGYSAEDSPITDDMVGWLTIDDTNIDYPVMQGDDNTKYINTDPYGEYALSGSIFLDCRNNSEFKDDYSIIYGHHMEYGKMFGAVDDFLDRDYIGSHRSGKLIVGKDAKKIYNLEVFACMKADAKNKIIFTPGKADNVRKEIKNKAEIYLADKNYPIIGLATCSTDASDERILVFCYIL